VHARKPTHERTPPRAPQRQGGVALAFDEVRYLLGRLDRAFYDRLPGGGGGGGGGGGAGGAAPRPAPAGGASGYGF
jgi:hypothetical protein